ncbi:hypothetical protein BSG8_10750 [Bacillus subtilis subsp. natto]|nr:hypothetical protein BsBEST3136_10560 [Bacillus subtilis]BCV99665.1 hypothetical protein BsBEST3145_10610 [Bacillus subtilis]BDB92323.1 hypothetical protein BSG8_10750 [Bacillus subtilis subsp. natto]BEH05090.1 hypothetical protein BSNN_11230 [Bacillus subtilis subsp. natto]
MTEISSVVLLKDSNRNGVKLPVDIWIMPTVKKKAYPNKYVPLNIHYTPI